MGKASISQGSAASLSACSGSDSKPAADPPKTGDKAPPKPKPEEPTVPADSADAPPKAEADPAGKPTHPAIAEVQEAYDGKTFDRASQTASEALMLLDDADPAKLELQALKRAAECRLGWPDADKAGHAWLEANPDHPRAAMVRSACGEPK